MRTMKTFALAVALSGSLAVTAGAQTPFSGQVATNNCSAPVDLVGAGGELYGWKIKDNGQGFTDILADLQTKPGSMGAVGGAGQSGFLWSFPPNWRLSEALEDVVFAVITFADGTFTVNSGQVDATGGGTSFTSPLAVGVGIPAAWGVSGGTGLVMEAFTGNLGVQVNVPAYPEVNTATFGAGGCHVGGLHPSPAPASNGLGIIAGYNIYRIPDAGGTPTRQDFYDAAIDLNPATGGFQYFLPYGSFDTTIGDTGPPGAPSDPNEMGDLAGMNNPDAMAYTGDDAVVLQDSPNNPDGTGRATGLPPLVGTTYWYAAQPVIMSPAGETIGDLAGTTLSGAGTWTVAGVDADGDGTVDAADLDGDGSIEFFSPQANAGIGGLGLTNGSLPLLSAPVQGSIDPAAAFGDVRFDGDFTGGDVQIQFTTALEGGNVLGFNVFRHHGDVRVPVNTEVISATGGEGSVYRLVDDLGQTARRMRRGGDLTYSVDVLYNDGTPTRMVGPFTVGMGERDTRETPSRRQR